MCTGGQQLPFLHALNNPLRSTRRSIDQTSEGHFPSALTQEFHLHPSRFKTISAAADRKRRCLLETCCVAESGLVAPLPPRRPLGITLFLPPLVR